MKKKSQSNEKKTSWICDVGCLNINKNISNDPTLHRNIKKQQLSFSLFWLQGIKACLHVLRCTSAYVKSAA